MTASSNHSTQVLATESDVKEALIDWNQYNGKRITTSVGGTVYLMFNGQLCAIPDETTFNLLFRNWGGIEKNDWLVNSAPKGPGITHGAVIVKGSDPAWYLITNEKKHWVPSMEVRDRFNFKDPTIVPQILLDFLPSGPNVR